MLRFPVLFCFACIALLAACEASGSSGHPSDEQVSGGAEPRGEYVVGGVLDGVHGAVQVLVNGFPPISLPTDGMVGMYAAGTGLDTPATSALVSGRNEVTVAVVPFLRSEPGPEGGLRAIVVPSRPRFRVWVEAPDGSVMPGTERGQAAVDSAYAAWEAELQRLWRMWLAEEDSLFSADPGLAEALATERLSSAEAVADGELSAGASLLTGRRPALERAWAWAAEHPVRVETSFVRPASGEGASGARGGDGQPSFDAVFREAPVIAGTPADSARLRAYAVRLYDLTVARDTAALMEALRPKYSDGFEQYGGELDPGETLEQYLTSLRDDAVIERVEPFTADDVRLRSWSGGRVWELYRDGASGLLRWPQVETRGGPSREVFVGQVDSALRVVR